MIVHRYASQKLSVHWSTTKWDTVEYSNYLTTAGVRVGLKEKMHKHVCWMLSFTLSSWEHKLTNLKALSELGRLSHIISYIIILEVERLYRMLKTHESVFYVGGNRSGRRKPSKSGWDRLKRHVCLKVAAFLFLVILYGKSEHSFVKATPY